MKYDTNPSLSTRVPNSNPNQCFVKLEASGSSDEHMEKLAVKEHHDQSIADSTNEPKLISL